MEHLTVGDIKRKLDELFHDDTIVLVPVEGTFGTTGYTEPRLDDLIEHRELVKISDNREKGEYVRAEDAIDYFHKDGNTPEEISVCVIGE